MRRIDRALAAGSRDELRGLTVDLPAQPRTPWLERLLPRSRRAAGNGRRMVEPEVVAGDEVALGGCRRSL